MKYVFKHALDGLSVLLLMNGLRAEDLVGIPVPGRVGTPEWTLDGADTDIGSSGGGSGDDWRVAHAQVSWDHTWIAAAIDYSMLTSRNPSMTPSDDYTTDPSLLSRDGAGRSDEITMALAFRKNFTTTSASTWIQAGPGLQLSGDLGGQDIQNSFHSVIDNAPNNLPYRQPGLRLAALMHAGAGSRIDLVGPFQLDLRAIDLITSSGWTRWRVESLLFETQGNHGVWAGVRQDGTAGHALTTIADAVAKHEEGLGLVFGMSWDIHDLQLGLETYHNIDDGGQDGFFSIAYVPDTTVSSPLIRTDSPKRWNARLGISGYDSRVAGTATDVAFDTGLDGLPRWMGVVIGIRDQDTGVPAQDEFSGRRLMLWGGLNANPILVGSPQAAITAYIEGGVGIRNDYVRAQGYSTVDGGITSDFTTPIARIAAGFGASFKVGPAQYGALALVEATAAQQHSDHLVVRNPYTPSVVTQDRQVPEDGNSIGGVLALTMVLNW